MDNYASFAVALTDIVLVRLPHLDSSISASSENIVDVDNHTCNRVPMVPKQVGPLHSSKHKPFPSPPENFAPLKYSLVEMNLP